MQVPPLRTYFGAITADISSYLQAAPLQTWAEGRIPSGGSASTSPVPRTGTEDSEIKQERLIQTTWAQLPTHSTCQSHPETLTPPHTRSGSPKPSLQLRLSETKSVITDCLVCFSYRNPSQLLLIATEAHT